MAPGPLFIACLCAEWCGTCRDYRPAFDAAAAAERDATFAWIDIEDRPEVMGDVEVETFPTLLIAHGDRVLFFGPVMPHPSTLASLVERARRGALGTVADAQVAQLAARARAADPG